MKIGFFGTPEVASYVLQKIYDGKHEIKWVVTQPDRPSGRGRKLSPPPVKQKALSLELKVVQSEKFNKDLFNDIKKMGDIDVAVVVAYGLYIPTYFIESLTRAPVNIHFSLLPKYRGASPVFSSILNGDDVTGVTIMKISKGMDEGDILIQEKVNIDIKDTTESLTLKLTEIGVDLLLKILEPYKNETLKTVSQEQTGIKPTYAKKISSDQRFINWNKSALDIHNEIRAMYPWPIAEAKINNINIKLISTMPVNSSYKDIPGTVVEVDKKKGFFMVQTKRGVLLVEKVKPSGKREMTVTEFLNGRDIKKGERFSNV